MKISHLSSCAAFVAPRFPRVVLGVLLCFSTISGTISIQAPAGFAKGDQIPIAEREY